MQYSYFSFPDWLNSHIPDDQLFAQAYQSIPDTRRALMKTAIARLYDWYGPQKVIQQEVTQQWTSGLGSTVRFGAVDFAVLLFDTTILSSARVLAALIPAISSGVKNVLAVRIDDEATPWDSALLTGFELAGQEMLVSLTSAHVRRLFFELRDCGATGGVTVLGPQAAGVKLSELQAASGMEFWRPRYTRAASVWMDGSSTFDLEALAFTHPDVQFAVFGTEVDFPSDKFQYGSGEFDEFLSSILNVAYVPDNHVQTTLRHAKLVLGPGQEGCWLWNDLHASHFQRHCTSWTLGE